MARLILEIELDTGILNLTTDRLANLIHVIFIESCILPFFSVITIVLLTAILKTFQSTNLNNSQIQWLETAFLTRFTVNSNVARALFESGDTLR